LSSDELSLFSYEVLGLVGDGGAGAHDLLQMARRGRMLSWAGESQYYAEPKRLARLGYLASSKEPGKTRPRTVYKLTDKGRRALRAYAATPVTFVPFKSDVLQRLLIADLVGEEVTRESMETLGLEIDELKEQLTEFEARTDQFPQRQKYMLLVSEFLRELLELHTRLADRVERELGS
jgi:DNA-binding PadR family transcriptional regulator